MGREVSDRERTKRIVLFLSKYGYVVSANDLLRAWRRSCCRNRMYWIWHNQQKKNLDSVLGILVGLNVRMERKSLQMPLISTCPKCGVTEYGDKSTCSCCGEILEVGVLVTHS